MIHLSVTQTLQLEALRMESRDVIKESARHRSSHEGNIYVLSLNRQFVLPLGERLSFKN